MEKHIKKIHGSGHHQPAETPFPPPPNRPGGTSVRRPLAADAWDVGASPGDGFFLGARPELPWEKTCDYDPIKLEQWSYNPMDMVVIVVMFTMVINYGITWGYLGV